MSPPRVDGDSFTWTERLTLRSIRFPEALASSMTLDVHAVVQDGKITAVAAPYPPFALRRPGAPADVASIAPNAAGAAPTPATLFVGTTLGLALTGLLVTKGGPAVGGAWQRRRA